MSENIQAPETVEKEISCQSNIETRQAHMTFFENNSD